MKNLILIFALLLLPVSAAMAAWTGYDVILSNPRLPMSGTVAGTGETISSVTTKWADAPQERVTDGKWFFPRLPDFMLAQLTPQEIEAFFLSFQPEIETYDASWVPEPETEF